MKRRTFIQASTTIATSVAFTATLADSLQSIAACAPQNTNYLDSIGLQL